MPRGHSYATHYWCPACSKWPAIEDCVDKGWGISCPVCGERVRTRAKHKNWRSRVMVNGSWVPVEAVNDG